MEIYEQRQGAVVVIRAHGALTAAEAETVRDAVLGAAARNAGRLCVDASGIPYVDSKGIEALVDVTDALGKSGQALKLCATNETVREALELTGWGEAFEYFEDVGAGVRSFL
jgi:anti-sigma B factor antagonist